MDYLCKQPEVGSTIECSIGNEKKEVAIRKAFYSKQVPSPDRVPRKEAYEMEAWATLKLGTFFIQEGKNIVKLKALKVKNKNVAEVNQLRLRLAED